MNNLKLDYSVIRLDDKPISDVLNSREVVESFKQFNLDSSLEIVKFGYIGPEVVIYDDYVKLIKSIFSNSEFTSSLKIFGTTKEVDIEIEIEELCTSVTSLDFFDCLDKVAPNGYIRGCYDEVYDRITVGDELREMLLNDQSINSTVFSDNDKKQFIYQIFRLVATGGPLCQPDISTQRYLKVTKSLYKALLTVYRDSKTNQTKMPSRVFHIKRVSSFQLFSDPDCSHSRLFIIIDPFLKHVRVIKNDYKSFW